MWFAGAKWGLTPFLGKISEGRNIGLGTHPLLHPHRHRDLAALARLDARHATPVLRAGEPRPARRGHGAVRALRRAPAAQRSARRRRAPRLPRQSALPLRVSSAPDTAAVRAGPRFGRSMPFIVAADAATWNTLLVFCAYRVVLAGLIGVAFRYFNHFFLLGATTPEVVVPTTLLYGLVALALLVPARMHEPNLTLQVTAGVVADVAAMVILMYGSGGVKSGLGIMLLVSLAAAGLITRGRLAFFHAAFASLALLGGQALEVWRFDAVAQNFLQAGLTSLAFFATAGLASTLAQYARTSEQIAEERKIDLANMSQI